MTCSSTCERRPCSSAAGDLSVAATLCTVDSRSCRYDSALAPVTASMRRTPAATPPSLTILNRPMSPVRPTWVPPHSSRLVPMSSTRTVSPYFSPNSIMAPVFWADSRSITRAWAAALASTSAFTMASI
ncbi:hypothetical protein D3C72_1923220 [compost metagenome]